MKNEMKSHAVCLSKTDDIHIMALAASMSTHKEFESIGKAREREEAVYVNKVLGYGHTSIMEHTRRSFYFSFPLDKANTNTINLLMESFRYCEIIDVNHHLSGAINANKYRWIVTGNLREFKYAIEHIMINTYPTIHTETIDLIFNAILDSIDSSLHDIMLNIHRDNEGAIIIPTIGNKVDFVTEHHLSAGFFGYKETEELIYQRENYKNFLNDYFNKHKDAYCIKPSNSYTIGLNNVIEDSAGKMVKYSKPRTIDINKKNIKITLINDNIITIGPKALYEELKNRAICDYLLYGYIKHCKSFAFTFLIEGISRTTSMQLNRSRMGITQESQRYCDMSGNSFVNPLDFKKTGINRSKKLDFKFKNDNKLSVTLRGLTGRMFSIYKQLRAMGMDKEDARAWLPANCSTRELVTFDLEHLILFMKNRLSKHAQAEIREVAQMMASLIEESK